MSKTIGSPQEFRIGRAITLNFCWGPQVSCRTVYESPSGAVVKVEPRIIKLEAMTDREPLLRRGDHRFWFAYWISTPDTRRRSGERLAFGGAGPVLSKGELLDLLKKAREARNFFTPDFWNKLDSLVSQGRSA